jgi:hypothetical protein
MIVIIDVVHAVDATINPVPHEPWYKNCHQVLQPADSKVQQNMCYLHELLV